MISVEVRDNSGDKKLKLYDEGELGVVVHAHPPTDEAISSYPFSQWFTDDGSELGSNDMRVDGSVIGQSFYIKAQTQRDIYIKTISVRISDNSAVLNKFGALTALTNGVDFRYKNDLIGDVLIQGEMKTNLDVIRLGLSSPPLGDGSSAFRADVSGSGADTYLPFIDLTLMFGFPWGLRLKKGTTDIIEFIVNDAIGGLDGFDIKGFGIQL